MIPSAGPSAVMTDYSKLLNPEQLAAATAPDGPLLILAAAGTGKTRTLIYRVAHLVERGIAPETILLLTFTNRAAREMLERARGVVGERVSGIWGGTFHHVANRMLRRFAPRLGYPHDFAILDADEQRSLVSTAMKRLKLPPKEFLKREVLLSLFSGARNRKRSLEEFIEPKLEELPVDPNDIFRVHDAYETDKQTLKAMDFDDLLIHALRLLREHREVREHYQGLFRHVLVDEYQDTNALQSDLVELLAEGCGNVSVVGDDFQCIYTWRGADFRNIMEFPVRHPDARIVKLERNYRSVPGVLELANACIEGNPDQFQKTLRPVRSDGAGLPVLIEAADGGEQAGELIRRARQLHRKGYAWSDMAILYRAHFHSIELQIELARQRIPTLVTSGVGVFEQAHVKDTLSFFRVAENPADRLAFDRLVGQIKGAGPSTTAKLWDRLGGRFEASSEAGREALLGLMPARLREAWRAIDRLLAEYAGLAGADETVTRWLDLHYRAYLHQQYENAQDREDDLRELVVQMRKAGSVREFLSDVALLTNVDLADEPGGAGPPDRLTLSTVHQAKGLEWPVVFIPWAVEGMFPSSRSLADDGGDGEAEERRLFYVAVTRARDALMVFTPWGRATRDGGFFHCEPSRFVTEVPRRLFDRRAAASRYRGW